MFAVWIERLQARPLLLSLAIAVCALTPFYLNPWSTDWSKGFEEALLLQFVQWRASWTKESHGKISICRIDDPETKDRYGEWPWAVEHLVEFVGELTRGGHVVAFAEFYGEKATGYDEQKLRLAFGDSKVVLGFKPIGSEEFSPDDQKLLNEWAIFVPAGSSYHPKFSSFPVLPSRPLAEHAALAVLGLPDSSPFVDEVDLFTFAFGKTKHRHDQGHLKFLPYPSLALRAVQLFELPSANITLTSSNTVMPRLKVGNKEIPIAADWASWVDYRLPTSRFKEFSAGAIGGQKNIPPQGIVFVGRTESHPDQLLIRPNHRLAPVEIYAHVAANLLGEEYVRFKEPSALSLSGLVALILVPLLAWLVLRSGAERGVVWSSAILGSWAFVSYAVFVATDVYLMTVWPTLSGMLAVALALPLSRWLGIHRARNNVSRGLEAMKVCKILFIAADPKSDSPLKIDEELRDIKKRIRMSDQRDNLELISAEAARTEDLLYTLNRHRPHIVHFSGHGTPGEEIVLVGSDGQPKPVDKKALKTLFEALRSNIRLVFLNSCYSRSQAEAIVETLDCAIGMKGSVGDEAAIIFAAAFYSAIGFRCSVQEAFDQSRAALLLESIAEEDTPDLFVREGVDASEVQLLQLAAELSRPAAQLSRPAKAELSAALKIWQEKLAHLEEQLAVASDAQQKFTIERAIAEAKAKIEELGAEQ